MGKITKNYIYNIIYQLIVLCVPLITAPYLSRVLGATANGIYSYVYSTAYIIYTICLLGIFNYGNREIAYTRDNRKEVSNTFWEIIGTRVVLAIFTTIIYLTISIVSGKYLNIFLIYYIYVIAMCIDCTWLYVGVEDMKWAVIKNTITKVLTVIGIFIFVKSSEDLWKYVLIQGLSLLISNLLAYSNLHLFIDFDKPKFTHLKKNIMGSLQLFLPTLAATIYLQCDKIMIELITGATNQVSFYDYSEKIVNIPLTFITVISTIMMPRIANEFKKNNINKIQELINKSISFSLFMALPMVFGLILTVDKMIPWYLGNEFIDTGNAIKYISPIIITNALSSIAGAQYFTATNQIGILVKAQVIALISNIIINALLIPQYGFYGAAIATVITSLFSAIIQLIHLFKQIKISNFKKYLIKYTCASIIMATLIYISSQQLHLNASPRSTLIEVSIGIISYVLICLLTKDENLLYILKKINNKRSKQNDRNHY